MTKYIVKNCPAFISKLFNWQQEEDNECLCTISPENVNSEMKKCEDCTDCPTKQVIELCMNYPEKSDNSLSNKILQTLQVEEVE